MIILTIDRNTQTVLEWKYWEVCSFHQWSFYGSPCLPVSHTFRTVREISTSVEAMYAMADSVIVLSDKIIIDILEKTDFLVISDSDY